MARKKYINNQIKETQPEENHIQSKREKKNVQRKIKEADNKLNISENIFIWCKMLCEFWFFFWKFSLILVSLCLLPLCWGCTQSLVIIDFWVYLLTSLFTSPGWTVSLGPILRSCSLWQPVFLALLYIIFCTFHYCEIFMFSLPPRLKCTLPTGRVL